MSFEFDSEKSESNKLKHGIDFVEAQLLWLGPNVKRPALTTGEPRSLIVGRIGDAFWTAIITRRNGNIRIISVRKSRDSEKEWL